MTERPSSNLPAFETKHSGDKVAFATGALRENKVDKLRFDLIPPIMLERLAGIYTRGARIYGDRNWEKGIPYSSLIASAWRHFIAMLRGATDEDHAAAVIWNITAMMYFDEKGRKEELDDR